MRAGAGVTLRGLVIPLAVAVLWVGVLASAAGAVYVKHRSRELFMEVEQLNRGRDSLEIEWGQLQLEQSAWSTHAFVERVATQRLRMGTPRADDIQVMMP
jgi:cell division protein FtsL